MPSVCLGPWLSFRDKQVAALYSTNNTLFWPCVCPMINSFRAIEFFGNDNHTSSTDNYDIGVWPTRAAKPEKVVVKVKIDILSSYWKL